MPADRSYFTASPGPSESIESTRSFGRVVNLPGSACRRCRQIKKKCDRARPCCAHCTKSKSDCEYDAHMPNDQSGLVSSLMADVTSSKGRIQWLETQLAAYTGTTISSTPPGPRLLRDEGDDLLSTLFAVGPTISTASSPSLAERLIKRLMTTELDRHDSDQSFAGGISKQLGAHLDEIEAAPRDYITQPQTWPPRPLAQRLIDVFFAATSGYYYMVDRTTVQADLNEIYSTAVPNQPATDSFASPDIRVYRLFMIFAIGCTRLRSQVRPLRTDTTRLRENALQHFSAVFRSDEMTCLGCILLFVFYCIVDFSPLSPYTAMEMTGQLVMEIEMHKENHDLPEEIKDARRKLFWTTYCLDRLISFTLTKQPVIPEAVITIEMPCVDRPSPDTTSCYDTSVAFFSHVTQMRRLSGFVLQRLYLDRQRDVDIETDIVWLNNAIDEWFESIPVRSDSTAYDFLELNYNLLLVFILRPSPMAPETKPTRLARLRRHAFRAIQLQWKLYAGQRCAENYVHLYNIITAAVALIYALSGTDGDPTNLNIISWRREATQQVELCEKLLSRFAVTWPNVSRFRETFQVSADLIKSKLQVHSSFGPPQTRFDMLFSLPNQEAHINVEPHAPLSTASPAYVPPDIPDSPVYREMWDNWVSRGASVGPTQENPLDSVIEMDLDSLLSTIGMSNLDAFWTGGT